MRKQWATKWPNIAKAVSRIVKSHGEQSYFRRFKGRRSPQSFPSGSAREIGVYPEVYPCIYFVSDSVVTATDSSCISNIWSASERFTTEQAMARQNLLDRMYCRMPSRCFWLESFSVEGGVEHRRWYWKLFIFFSHKRCYTLPAAYNSDQFPVSSNPSVTDGTAVEETAKEGTKSMTSVSQDRGGDLHTMSSQNNRIYPNIRFIFGCLSNTSGPCRDVEAAISSTASASTPIASASTPIASTSNRTWALSHLWTCWQAWLSKPAAYDLQGHITS